MFVHVKPTTKQRILAFFMAFVIIFVSLPYLGVDKGVRVNALSGTDVITTNTTETHYSDFTSITSDSIYNYNGKIQASTKVSVFDYVSDAEFVSGAGWSYNDLEHTAPPDGYDDAFTAFNNAIASTGSLKSASSDNTTIKFKSTNNKCTRAYVHFWNTTSINTSWPGMPMIFNPIDNCFYLTVPNSALGTSSPTFKINGGKDGNGTNTWDTWQSKSRTITHFGKEYYWEKDVYDGYVYDYATTDGGDPWSDGKTDAQPIYYSNYTYPLYFGCFYLGANASDYSTKKALYDKFYWQPNISIRDSGDDASVQNLVYGTLSGGSKTGNLLSSNGQELPYFSTTWADTGSNSKYVKYYNQSGAGDSYIAFPFYEALADASNSNIAGTNKSSSTAKAKFYEFNSAKTNLQFVGDAGTHTGYFKESTTPINSNWGRQGFFPFNTTNNSKKNNLGFGMKFEMNFKLQKDGCVGVVNSSGEDLKYDATTQPERINTIFEFEGDDDLWVYLDGHLILDLGGSHFKSKGKIDFAQKTAVAYEAIKIGDGQGVDDLDPASDRTNPRQLSVSTSDFTTILGDTYNTVAYPNQYDPTKQHTITVFYMERGMGDSNLKIRYNYNTENNFSKMKIQEVTDFSDVNIGLIPATKKAADYDVFEYTTLNTGTNKKEDVKDNSLLYPTNSETHTRDVQSGDTAHSLETVLTSTSNTTPQQGGNFLSDKADSYNSSNDPVKNTNYYWVDNFAGMDKIDSINHKGVGRTDSSGRMYLMYGTVENTDKNTEDIEVSGEFIKQFKRGSTMKITQGTKLYSPDREASPVATLNINNVRGASTLVDSYYTTTVSLNDYNFTNTWTLNSGDSFIFDNGDGTITPGIGDHITTKVDSNTDVMMTETFTNKIKVGAITITKAKASNDPDSITSGKSFKIKVRFKDVFGVTGVNGDADADYSSIKYKVYSSNGTVQNGGNSYDMEVDTTADGDKCGTITLEVNQTATIEGIPYGTKYYIYEEEPKYKASITPNYSGTVAVGTISYPDLLAPTSSGGNNVTVTNFSNSLTIKEVTSFEGVNAGLLTYTKKAAENDVFKYTVSNEGTSSSDVVDSGLLAPTNEINIRNEGTSYATQLTANNTVEDTGYVYLDISGNVVNTDWSWSVSDALIAAYVNNGTTGKTVWGEYVSSGVYKYPLTIDGVTYNQMAFKRFDPNGTAKDDVPYDGEKNGDWNNSTSSTVIGGKTYVIRKRQSNGEYVNDVTSQPTRRISVTSTTNNYDPDNITAVNGTKPVSNTNYEWKDEFASNTPFTNTTGDDGELYLMHGTVFNAAALTENKESSATFYNQFKRDNNSIMTVEQVNTLYSPDRTQTPDALGSTGQRTSNTLGTYYTMSKSLSGSQTAFSPADSNSFVYNDLNTNKSVKITETFTNTVKNGAISVHKQIKNNEFTTETFTFKIKLEDVFGVDSADVDDNGYGGITISGTNNANNKLTNDGRFTIPYNVTAKIIGIPVGTNYTITEISASESEFEFDSSGSSNYSGTVEAYENESDQTPHANNKVVIQNKRKSTSSTEIILKKTAKEQVGTTKIGDTLAGAKFQLVNVNAPTTDIKLKKTDTDPAGAISGTTTKEYTVSTAGTYNISSNWIETGEDGRLHIKGLAPGDYYLEEQTAPAGYSNLDSNNVVSGTAQKKRVYFSIGDNTTTKYLTCSDEMAPAYIKLYEHINEKLPAWGNPTFIFKITQTKDAGGNDLTMPKTQIVALTVNEDNVTIANTIKWYDNGTAINFGDGNDPIDNSLYGSWLVEGTTESEYKGMYHIDSQGRIKVAPGTYEIIRVPVSRYKYVTSGVSAFYDTDTEPEAVTPSTETITITNLSAGKTVDVHYYDKVDYYDKFSHVDTKINKFYKLENGVNTTVKGLIVKYDGKAGSSNSTINITSDDNFKAKLVYADGTERDVTDKTKITIDTKSISGLSFDSNTHILTITTPSDHTNKVYTLEATYDSKFTTTFDLVFARS